MSNLLASATVVPGGSDVGTGAPWQLLPCQADSPIVCQSYTPRGATGWHHMLLGNFNKYRHSDILIQKLDFRNKL